MRQSQDVGASEGNNLVCGLMNRKKEAKMKEEGQRRGTSGATREGDKALTHLVR